MSEHTPNLNANRLLEVADAILVIRSDPYGGSRPQDPLVPLNGEPFTAEEMLEAGRFLVRLGLLPSGNADKRTSSTGPV